MISDLQQPSGSSGASGVQDRAAQRALARLEARLAARAVVDFTIPLEDTDEFQSLGSDECRRVRRVLAVFREIHEHGAKVRHACEFQARKLAVEGVRGWSASRIKNTYYEFAKSGKKAGRALLFEAGDWRMLARWQRQAHTGLSGRPAFLRLWATLCDNHQRSAAGAFRDLASLYTSGFTSAGNKVKGVVWGETFPGYATWPDAVPHTGLPEGWTKANLAKHTPDRFERTAARTGIKKASGEGLKARFSRVGVLPYSVLSGDDEQQDVQCLVPGQTEPVRPRGLGLHDYASDALVDYVMKATWWDADAEKQRTLNERDTMWFVLGYLTRTGFRADTGTQLLVERGTFAIRGDTRKPERAIDDPDRNDLEARLWRATGGKVTVARSQGFAKAAHGGQFAPPVGGNPRFKPVERVWANLRNRVDGLPGQVGMDRNHKPESMGREEANAIQLLKTIGLLPSAQAEKLQLPFLTFGELAGQVYQAVRDFNAEAEHEIGEWEKCGFLAKEYFDSAAGDWFPVADFAARLATFSEGQSVALAESLKANPSFLRVRRMTRAEALATGKAALQRLPLSALLEVVGRENAMNGGELKAVRAGEFVFHVKEIDADEIAFLAVDADGQPLREGARYLCVVNPLCPDACVIYDEQERFVSVCPRRVAASRADASAVMQMVGSVQQWRNAKLADMRERHGEDAARVEFVRAHNAAVVSAARPELAKARQQEREQEREQAAFSSAAADEFLAVADSGEEPEAVTVSEPSAADDFLAAL